MGIFKRLTKNIVDATADGASKIIDESTTSLEERGETMNERLRIDTSGSFLQRNIRPLITLWIVTILTLSAYDVIKPQKWFQDLIAQSFIYVICFYFVERGLRHIVNQITRKK